MEATPTKVRALILICLLAGHEVQSVRTKMWGSRPKGDKNIIPTYKEANQKCSWRGRCVGDGCTSRPLPLDKSLSASCRLSTEHMVNSDQFPMYVDLMTNLFNDKFSTYRTKCLNKENKSKRGGPFEKVLCTRRLGQMMHTVLFITAAEAQLKTLPDSQNVEERAKIEANITSTSEQLAELFTNEEDHDLVVSFFRSIMQYAAHLGDSLKAFCWEFAELLGNLMDGSEDVKEETRKSIGLLEEKLKLVHNEKPVDTNLNMTLLENQADDGANNLVEAVNKTGSSLLELGTQGCGGRRAVYVFLFPLFSVLTAGIFSVVLLIDILIGGRIWRWFTCAKEGDNGKALEKLEVKNKELKCQVEQLKMGDTDLAKCQHGQVHVHVHVPAPKEDKETDENKKGKKGKGRKSD